MRASHPEGPCPFDGPRAHCTADSAGGLTFDVGLPGGGERWDAALLLRPTGPDPDAGPGAASDGAETGEPVRLPLFPSGGERLRAALPSTMQLAEGRWAGYLALGEETPRRLLSGQHDLSSLVDREPSVHRTWLGVRIPYATASDGLSLRSWLRWPHAEAGEVHLTDTALVLRGRLYGAEPGPAARLEARPREAAAGAAVGTAPAAHAPVTRDGTGFRCALPFAALPPAGDWDLWLRASRTAEPVRVARILDDVPDKRRLVCCPPRRSASGTVTTYWTPDNDLALRRSTS